MTWTETFPSGLIVVSLPWSDSIRAGGYCVIMAQRLKTVRWRCRLSVVTVNTVKSFFGEVFHTYSGVR